MLRHSIPTARYPNLNDFEWAERYINDVSFDIVIKASGLAARKGVIFPESKSEAISAVKEMTLNRKFGHSGSEVVIEEFLDGEELSILTFRMVRILDIYQPPRTTNEPMVVIKVQTGEIATPALLEKIDDMMLWSTLDGLRQEQIPFADMLFTSLMITPTCPKVLEYNARFRNPETQTLLPLLNRSGGNHARLHREKTDFNSPSRRD